MNQDLQDSMSHTGQLKKHGFDKRRAYLSSEILSGQISREEALDRISQPELTEDEMINDFRYVAKKLDWTEEEFKQIFNGDNKSFRDYKNNFFWIKLATKISNVLTNDKRLFR